MWGDSGGFDFDTNGSSKKDKKSRRNRSGSKRSDNHSPDFGGGDGGGFGDGGGGGFGGPTGSNGGFGDGGGGGCFGTGPTGSNDFGSSGAGFGGPTSSRSGGGRMGAFEGLLAAERMLVQSLRVDTDELDEELHQLEELCRQEEREAARERAEADRIEQERVQLEGQIDASRRNLGELKREHEILHMESITLRRDRNHYGTQAAFLEKVYEEGVNDVQSLQRSVEYLEQSNQSLAAHTQSLEEARREILEQVRYEKELLRKEELEAQSAKQSLETLRGSGSDRLARFGNPAPSVAGDDAFGFGASTFDGGAAGGGDALFSSYSGGGLGGTAGGGDAFGGGGFGAAPLDRGPPSTFSGDRDFGGGRNFPPTTTQPSPSRTAPILREGV